MKVSKLDNIKTSVAGITGYVPLDAEAKQQIKDFFVGLLKSDSEVFNSEDAKGQMAIMEWGNELIAKVDDL